MKITDWKQRYGHTALIAGGSEGIGRAFAERLASVGIDLILLARNIGPLQRAASEIRARHNVQVEVHALDLIRADVSEEIDRIVDCRDIGTLIYNAGAVHGAALFLDKPLDHAVNLIRLNCVGPATFVHRLAPAMRQRKRGAIILVSSAAGLSGSGYIAAYASSKAYETTFAESLWIELGSEGVDVLGLIAGATETPSMERSGVKFTGAADDLKINPMDPYDVADAALVALGNGPLLVPAQNTESVEWIRSAPRPEAVQLATAGCCSIYGVPSLRVRSFSTDS